MLFKIERSDQYKRCLLLKAWSFQREINVVSPYGVASRPGVATSLNVKRKTDRKFKIRFQTLYLLISVHFPAAVSLTRQTDTDL